ncbi:hypothetical protein KEM54_006582 [Ascosphaera aggregata]|nr:hypothetical protein KEM54_006582 [Ascosphaera aggregata]
MPTLKGDQRHEQRDFDGRPAHRGFRDRWRHLRRERGGAEDDVVRREQGREQRSEMHRHRVMSSKHAAAINHAPQVRRGTLRHRIDVIERPAHSFDISVKKSYSIWPTHIFSEKVFKHRGYTAIEAYACHVHIFGLDNKWEIRDMFERCKKALQFEGYLDLYFHHSIDLQVLRQKSNTVSRDSGYSSERLRHCRVNRDTKPEYITDDDASEDSESWDEIRIE